MLKIYTFVIFIGFLCILIVDVTVSVVQTTTELENQPVQPCGRPLPPNNGTVSVWGNNLLVEYTCDEGLFPVGRIFGSCNPFTKRWSIKRVLCVSSACDPPKNLTNGKLYFEERNSIVFATCRHGYKLTGSRERYCDGYTWRGYTPSCNDKYPSGEPRQKNDVISTTPNTQIIKRGISEEDILDADKTCYTQYSDPPFVKNATFGIVYKYNKVLRDWILIANYTCDTGFIFNDTTATYLYCKNFKWVGKTVPVCISTVIELAPADPCQNDNGGCEQICVSRGGGVRQCECRPGYFLHRFKRQCNDVDECRFGNGGCEHTCINIVGSFFCTCNTGYVSAGLKCLDLDECRTPGGHRCTGECINVPGSYTCNCTEPGYTETSDKTSCQDFNECDTNNGGCLERCINTIGSYQCGCKKKGFKISEDGSTCVDIDECVNQTKERCTNGVCKNDLGLFTCHCNDGYVPSSSRRTCLDIDECKINNGGCSDVCENTVGSFKCRCHGDGYILAHDSKSCSDVNECEISNGNCEDFCTNMVGSYKCSCREKFTVLHTDGHTCTTCDRRHFYDDESGVCVPCPANSSVDEAMIIATRPEDCVCDMGFYSNKSLGECIDIDECNDGMLQCKQLCINTQGSAFCECKEGYESINSSSDCIDVDECIKMPCTQWCENMDGTYRCLCLEGYILAHDQITCLDIDECLDGILVCDQGCVNANGTAYCTCEKGFKLSEDNATCEDIDECSSENTHLCEDKCINTVGSYECDCLSNGLKLSWDLASCVDINECMEGGNNCTGTCVNTLGSYRCQCFQEGFVTSSDGTICEDQDECSNQDLNTCDETCINTIGSFRCDCFLGHALVGYNECAPCPKDYYRDMEGVECVSCPINAVTVHEGSESLEDCVCMEGYQGNLTSGEECTPE